MDSINEHVGDFDMEMATSLLTLWSLSFLTEGTQTITKIVQMIENSVHTFMSFGNFMKDQRYFWLRRR